MMREAYNDFSNNLDEALNVIGILKAHLDFKNEIDVKMKEP